MSFLEVESWDRIRVANQVLQALWDHLDSRGEKVELPQEDAGLAGALYWVGTCRVCGKPQEERGPEDELDGVHWDPGHGGWVCERHLSSPH